MLQWYVHVCTNILWGSLNVALNVGRLVLVHPC